MQNIYVEKGALTFLKMTTESLFKAKNPQHSSLSLVRALATD